MLSLNISKNFLLKTIMTGILFLGASYASAASFTVNSTSDASDTNIGDGICDDGLGNCTLRAAIQEANVSTNADTITITTTGTTYAATTYPNLNSGNITIIGPGSANFIIDGSGMTGGAGMIITSSNNSISGITINAFPGENMHLENADSNTFDDIVSSNSGAGTAGIEAIASSDNLFTNSEFSGTRIGIRFIGGSDNNIVEYSTSHDNDHSGMTSYTASGNIFRHNTLNANQNGMYLIQAVNTTVEDNVITNSVDAGINVFESTSTGNLIQDNTITTADVGVVVDQFSGSSTIHNNTISYAGAGILVGDVSGQTVISGNDISASGVGIELVRESDDVQIISNTITQNTSEGLRVTPSVVGTAGYLVDGNDIQNNGAGGITIGDNTNDITITDNEITGNQGNGITAFGTDITTITIGGAVSGDGNVISGNSSGVILEGVDGVTIQGNLIGLDATGATENANGDYGINLVDVSNALVGGTTASSRNYIVSNEAVGMGIEGTSDTINVVGNYFGLNTSDNPTGVLDVGIALDGDLSTVIVGGTSSGEGNVFAGAMTAGILSSGSEARVFGNKIGTDIYGDIVSGYGNAMGIMLIAEMATNNQIGGTGTGEANIIAGNELAGIVITGFESSFAQDNTISGNSIYGNDGNGIDLVEDIENPVFGPTANDSGDSDDGPNDFLNTPVITNADVSSGDVTYDLDIPAGYYHVEFFKNPTLGASSSGFGEGEVYVGTSSVVTSTGSALTGQTYAVSGGISTSDVITATVTECADSACAGLLATSEFSNAVTGTESLSSQSSGNNGNGNGKGKKLR